jgi:hypothetical protein
VGACRRHGLRDDPVERGQRRRLGRQPGEHGGDRRAVALDLDHHAAPVVAHEAVEPQFGRQSVHEGPEADALHDALDADPHPLDRRRHSRGRSRISFSTQPYST